LQFPIKALASTRDPIVPQIKDLKLKKLFTDYSPLVGSAAMPENSREKWNRFALEIDRLGRELRDQVSEADFRHLLTYERWGRVASFLGYATAWILPNPISALFISFGNFTRWASVFHPISHGAFDCVSGIPKRYSSSGFAQGPRRFLDWFDWITPQNWDVEHNHLHHYFTGGEKDPDILGRNAALIRSLRAPLVVRYLISIFLATIWKPFYYAANTLAERRHLQGRASTNRIGWNNWNPFHPLGRELWLTCLLPYAIARFVILPALFLPLGLRAALYVLANSALAELLTNLHSFCTIAPNHSGEDIPIFNTPAKGRADFFLRQIIGTVNFPTHGEFGDFLVGGMNYQIEHHLWPDLPLRQYQRARPLLKAICAKYGVPYKEEPIFRRVWITLRLMAGAGPILELPSGRIL
jgi:fatty acid desaturase